MIREKTHAHTREPIIRMVKRDAVPWWKAWLIRLIAIVAALVVCAVVIYTVTGLNPLGVYKAMFDGTFGAVRRLWSAIRDTAVLLCIAVAITPAFRMRFWNIGAEGQVLVGGLATATVMKFCGDSLPVPVLFIVMIAASLVAGIVWGLIPALFKAKWNTNETLFTLMMNYVAIQLVSFFSIKWEALKGSGNIGVINQDTNIGWIPTDFLPDLFGNFNYSISAIIVLLITVFIYIYLRYSKHGYEIAVVGESENTAKYAGISVKKVILRTMALSGAICGIAGFVIVAGSSHTITTGTAGGDGFTAIIVSWLAKFNPFVMILVAFLLTFLNKGAGQIASQFNLNIAFSEVITGIILFFILGCEFFINYKLIRNKRKKEEK